jgi:transposase
LTCEEINNMTSIALGRSDVVVGVDTHKDEHVAVALDGLGGRLGELAVPARPDGYDQLVAWADGLGTVAVFGVEGTGSYGSGLARYLRRHARRAVEVSRPPRRGERRLSGKSDPIDAEHAARAVLAGTATTTPKLADGIVEAIRLVKIARDSAVNAHSQAMITLKAVLVTAPDNLRGDLEPLSDHKLMIACSNLDRNGSVADPAVAVRHVLASLARRWLDLHEEIKVHTGHLKHLTKTAAPDLVAAFGIGPDIAAELLVTAGDNTDRVHSEAALAKLCGACPIPAGSGKTNGRHRLNRGGNRQANAALYRAVIVRMRWHPPTIAYVERRTTEGLSKREIIRCLKRYLAREIYRLLPPPSTATGALASTA